MKWILMNIDETAEEKNNSNEEDDEENIVEDSINVEDVFGPEMWDDFSFTAQEELQKLDSELVYDVSESLFSNF